jgi:hypothetical protein
MAEQENGSSPLAEALARVGDRMPRSATCNAGTGRSPRTFSSPESAPRDAHTLDSGCTTVMAALAAVAR